MKIISGYIDWMTHCHNAPSICVVIDKVPELNEFRFENRDGLYFAELDGAVSMFFYREPGRGFGGHHFEITMKDGSNQTLIGPWSSGSYAANAAGFTPSAEITVEEGKHCLMSSHATVALIQKAMDDGIIELRDYLPHPHCNNPRYMGKRVFPKGSRLEMRSGVDMIESLIESYEPVVVMPDGSVFDKFAFLKEFEKTL